MIRKPFRSDQAHRSPRAPTLTPTTTCFPNLEHVQGTEVDIRIRCILWILLPYKPHYSDIPAPTTVSHRKINASPVHCHRFSSRTRGLSQDLLCRSADKRDIENSNAPKEHTEAGMPIQHAIDYAPLAWSQAVQVRPEKYGYAMR